MTDRAATRPLITMSIMHGPPLQSMDAVIAQLAPCSIGRHQLAQLAAGGVACGLCGRPFL